MAGSVEINDFHIHCPQRSVKSDASFITLCRSNTSIYRIHHQYITLTSLLLWNLWFRNKPLILHIFFQKLQLFFYLKVFNVNEKQIFSVFEGGLQYTVFVLMFLQFTFHWKQCKTNIKCWEGQHFPLIIFFFVELCVDSLRIFLS